jgi:hypothetical protein
MPNNSNAWKSQQLSHEGFPLLIRHPEEINTESVKSLFPELAVITREFSKVSSDGLPDPDYNDKLLQFDSDIRSAFEEKNIGCAVLIETFGGKRRYYIYFGKADIDAALSKVRRDNPDEKLSWLTRPDPDWNFIRQYGQKFLRRQERSAGSKGLF